MKITIDTHNASREEVKELNEYLENKCWDFKTVEKKAEPKYMLKEDVIHVFGSHGATINEKIFDEELFEYRITDRKDFINTLISWIGEARTSDKDLMKEDLELLMNVEDDYIFSSISTNKYLYVGCEEFESTCEELLELNDSLKKEK